MKTQKSFQNESASLYIVATPIGNLGEMTPRAIETLKTVDIIAAEDTRVTQKLLNHFDIKTKTMSYHLHNEQQSAENIIKHLKQNESVALVSDAGYPLISDPGQTLVNEVLKHDFNVIPISGSSAFLNALVASGLVTQPFTFMGFLESKDSAIINQAKSIQDIKHTLVFYLSVHKVERTMQHLYDVLGDRKITLAREITKLHEEFIRTSLKEIIDTPPTLKGEFVLVLEGKTQDDIVSIESLIELVEKEISNGNSPSRSISKIAKAYKFSKNELYNTYQDHINKV